MAADEHECGAIRDLILRLKRSPALTVEDQAGCWKVSISKQSDLVVEVTVPHDVLEWFVTVRRDGTELWSDWMDYYAIDEHSKDLHLARATDVEQFVQKISETTVRAVESRSLFSKRPTIQWLAAGTWTRISLSEPTQ